MDCSMPGFPVHHQLPELAQTHVYRVSDAIQPTISSSVVPCSSRLQSFPALGSFPMSQFFTTGGQSTSFSISPSNEYSGLISFRTDWFDLHAVQGTLRSLLQHHKITSWQPWSWSSVFKNIFLVRVLLKSRTYCSCAYESLDWVSLRGAIQS